MNLTDQARRVMQFANMEAQRFNHDHVGTEHVLLGLLKECNGMSANVFKNLDINPRKLYREVENCLACDPDMNTMGKLPLTHEAEKVTEYAIEEASNLNDNCIDTEHLLLGLLQEPIGVAARVLKNQGLTLEGVRAEIKQIKSRVDPPESDRLD